MSKNTVLRTFVAGAVFGLVVYLIGFFLRSTIVNLAWNSGNPLLFYGLPFVILPAISFVAGYFVLKHFLVWRPILSAVILYVVYWAAIYSTYLIPVPIVEVLAAITITSGIVTMIACGVVMAGLHAMMNNSGNQKKSH